MFWIFLGAMCLMTAVDVALFRMARRDLPKIHAGDVTLILKHLRIALYAFAFNSTIVGTLFIIKHYN